MKVFDGNSTRSKELYFNSTEHYLSLTDALVVVWNYPAVVDNTTGVFRLDFETKGKCYTIALHTHLLEPGQRRLID